MIIKYECSRRSCVHLSRDIQDTQRICRDALGIALSCAARATPARGHMPLPPLLTGFSASMPLLPGLSVSTSQIPFTTPPRMVHQLHSKPIKLELAPLSL